MFVIDVKDAILYSGQEELDSDICILTMGRLYIYIFVRKHCCLYYALLFMKNAFGFERSVERQPMHVNFHSPCKRTDI